MAGSTFYFDPSATGTAVFLGPSESELMELAWKHRRLTAKKALVHLGHPGRAYTTVGTILGRLGDKGLLHRKRIGRTFEYTPAIDRDSFLSQKIELVRNCLFRNFGTGRNPQESS